MKRLSNIDRRTYMRGLCGATALAGGIPVVAGGAAGGGADDDESTDDDTDEHLEHPAARPILCDVDGDMTFNTVMHYDGDPEFPDMAPVSEEDHDEYPDPDSPRDRVVHVTSDSMETSDYAASLVNLRKRTRRGVTLGDVEEGELTYDYFQGPDHMGSAPDEAFLVLQTPDQAEMDKGVALFKHVDDSQDAPYELEDGEWKTVDVVDEMKSGEWRGIEIYEDPEKMRLGEETVGQAVERTAASLRDEEETFDDVVHEYGKDAELVGVGFGVGNTTSETRVDVYYDNLFVKVPHPGRGPPDDTPGRGPPDDTPGRHRDDFWEFHFDFPAVVPMDLEFVHGDGEERIAELRFTQEEMGLDRDDVIRDMNITLYAYSEAAPPLEDGLVAPGGGVTFRDGSSATSRGYDVTFDASDIADLDRLGNDEAHVLVAGQFQHEIHPQIVWFLGEGTVDLDH